MNGIEYTVECSQCKAKFRPRPITRNSRRGGEYIYFPEVLTVTENRCVDNVEIAKGICLTDIGSSLIACSVECAIRTASRFLQRMCKKKDSECAGSVMAMDT